MTKTIGKKSSLTRILPLVSLNKFPPLEKSLYIFFSSGFLKYQTPVSADSEIYLLTSTYKQK